MHQHAWRCYAMVHGVRSGHGETSGAIIPDPGGRSTVVSPLGWSARMGTFFIAVTSIALAEIGDRTQLLSLALAAHYRRPWPIVAGILGATIANHAVAGLVGAWFGRPLTPAVLDGMVGVSMIAMAAWVLHADTLRGDPNVSNRSAFLATLV